MSAARTGWWRDAVVYQVYPRSFQDSDGDGVGDLAGVTARIDALVWLGVDALWLSPFFASPLADWGYDISDYTAVDQQLGGLDDVDALLTAAHERGIRVLFDLVASHTSIEHPWFREHPDRYVWADDGPPNNWRAAFGGPAWSRDEGTGRWYLHSHYREQPDLDWRNPAVREAIAEVMRFWLARGVDGFRIDAMQVLVKDLELRDDPAAAGEPALPLSADLAALDPVHSRNAPETRIALRALREAAGDALLVGEVYLPTESLGPYLEQIDLAFAFEFMHSPWRAEALAPAIAAAARTGRAAWVLSNHDFSRLATRLGPDAVRAAAMLLLTLPGPAFVYQGDEIGMADGPQADPPRDRAGRDRFRSPMQWEPGPAGGFSDAEPWLPVADPERRNVADQRRDPGSLLWLYRRLIALRPSLGAGFEILDAPEGMLAYRRGDHIVAINLGRRPAPPPRAGEPLLWTDAGERPPAEIPPNGGLVFRPTRV